jgi:hypothetical protein
MAVGAGASRKLPTAAAETPDSDGCGKLKSCFIVYVVFNVHRSVAHFAPFVGIVRKM